MRAVSRDQVAAAGAVVHGILVAAAVVVAEDLRVAMAIGLRKVLDRKDAMKAADEANLERIDKDHVMSEMLAINVTTVTDVRVVTDLNQQVALNSRAHVHSIRLGMQMPTVVRMVHKIKIEHTSQTHIVSLWRSQLHLLQKKWAAF